MGNSASEAALSPDFEEKAKKAFLLMDKNHDGFLDRAEWIQLTSFLHKREESLKGGQVEAADASAIEKFVDRLFVETDGIGDANSLVSFPEFFKFLQTERANTQRAVVSITVESPHEKPAPTSPSPEGSKSSGERESAASASLSSSTSSAPGSPASPTTERLARQSYMKRQSVRNFRAPHARSTSEEASSQAPASPAHPPAIPMSSSTPPPSTPTHDNSNGHKRESSLLTPLAMPSPAGENSDPPLSARTTNTSHPVIEGLAWDEEIKVGPGTRPIPKAATLERLVEELTPTGDSNLQYMRYFLITYRSFTSPTDLVHLLIKRFRAPADTAQTTEEVKERMILQRRVLRFVKKWVEEAFYDFSSASLNELTSFLDSDVKGPYKAVYDSIMSAMRAQVQIRNQKAKSNDEIITIQTSESAATPSTPSTPAGLTPDSKVTEVKTRPSRSLSRASTYNPASSSVAEARADEQKRPSPDKNAKTSDKSDKVSKEKSDANLSRPSSPTPVSSTPVGSSSSSALLGGSDDRESRERKSRISRHSRQISSNTSKTIAAMVNQGQIDWKKVDVKEFAIQLTLADFACLRAIHYSELLFWLKARLKPQAPHVQQFIERFNRIGTWVATQIVTAPTLKLRIKILSTLIQVAKTLEVLNNFNAVMAILGGINSNAVHRLKFTFDGLSEEDKASLAALSNLMDNHSSFANYRKRWADAKGCRIPYLGVVIQDLLFVDEGSADITTDGLINFRKRRRMAAYLEDLQQVQNYAYAQPQIPELYEVLDKLEPQMNEKDQYSESLLREPRQATLKDIA